LNLSHASWLASLFWFLKGRLPRCALDDTGRCHTCRRSPVTPSQLSLPVLPATHPSILLSFKLSIVPRLEAVTRGVDFGKVSISSHRAVENIGSHRIKLLLLDEKGHKLHDIGDTKIGRRKLWSQSLHGANPSERCRITDRHRGSKRSPGLGNDMLVITSRLHSKNSSFFQYFKSYFKWYHG